MILHMQDLDNTHFSGILSTECSGVRRMERSGLREEQLRSEEKDKPCLRISCTALSLPQKNSHTSTNLWQNTKITAATYSYIQVLSS